MQKWEHKIITVRDLQPESLLNSLGDEGWELVAVSPETDDAYLTLFLKRAVGYRQATERTKHLSEITRIVEGATRGDIVKVHNYVGLLIDKLEEDGEMFPAECIRRILNGDAGAQVRPATQGSERLAEDSGR